MKNTNHQFSIALPNEWKDNTVFTFQGPNTSGIQHNLIITVDTEFDKTLDTATYARLQFNQSKDSLPGFKLIKKQKKQFSNEIRAYEILYKYNPSDGVSIFQKQLYLILEEKAYTFTSSYSKKTLNTVAKDVDKIIISFITNFLNRL